MSLQTLKNKAFRVSVQWNALVRKPLSLERGGFTEQCEHDKKTHLLEKQINKAKECLSLVKQYRDNKRDCAVWIIDYLIVELLVNGGFDD